MNYVFKITIARSVGTQPFFYQRRHFVMKIIQIFIVFVANFFHNATFISILSNHSCHEVIFILVYFICAIRSNLSFIPLYYDTVFSKKIKYLLNEKILTRQNEICTVR